MSIAAKCTCGAASFCTGICKEEKVKTANEILFEHGIETMSMNDDFNSQLLNAMERYAEQKVKEKDLIIYGIEEGAENWELEYKMCRDVLQRLVDVSKENTAEAPYKIIPLYREAEKFLSKYQHL